MLFLLRLLPSGDVSRLILLGLAVWFIASALGHDLSAMAMDYIQNAWWNSL